MEEKSVSGQKIIDGLQDVAAGRVTLTEYSWPKLYVCESRGSTRDGTLTGDEVFSVSTDPAVPGWETDGGCAGYGISAVWASRIVLAANAHHRLIAAAEAAIAYDDAIRSCGNDPDKMTSFQTAQGDDLDSLYLDWMTKARSALHSATRAGGG